MLKWRMTCYGTNHLLGVTAEMKKNGLGENSGSVKVIVAEEKLST